MSTKTVYQCDLDGWFIGPTVAHESPLEPGVFHIPAGCVEDAPPEAEDGLTQRWIAGLWAQQVKPAEPVRTPQQILAEFLSNHPEVAALVMNGAQPTNV